MGEKDVPLPLRTATSTSLLEGLRDSQNEDVWKRYVERYRPLLLAYSSRFGIPRDDAEDVAQGTLLAFLEAYRGGRYGKEGGRLRSWLFGIAHNHVLKWREKQVRRERIASDIGSGVLEGVPSPEEAREVWESEWHRVVLRECLDEIRFEVQPQTFEAFRLFALEEWPAERVAAELGITQNAVFGAKRRVLQRLNAILPFMEEAW